MVASIAVWALVGPRHAHSGPVTVTGFESGLHIDAYGYKVIGGNDGTIKAVSAPFSHDAGVPEPSALMLLGAGLLGALLRRR